MYQFSEKQKVYHRIHFVAFTKLGTLEGPCLHVLQEAVNIFQINKEDILLSQE